MKLLTLQHKKVLELLKRNKIYRADYSRIFDTNYKKQYKQLSKCAGFVDCPIFCAPISDDSTIENSGLEKSSLNVYLELDVPDDECYVTEYYSWTDYLYYTSEEYDKEIASECLQDLSKNKIIENCNTPQIIIDRIEPKWLIKVLEESVKESYSVEHKTYGNVVYETNDLEDAKAEVKAIGPRSYIIRDDKGDIVDIAAKPLYVYRGESDNTLSKKTGISPSGIFFGDDRKHVTGWGKVNKYLINKDAKIFEYESSDSYCNDFNLYDKTYPEFKKYFGMYGDIESLSQFTKLTKEQQNEINDRVEKYAGNNFCWYDYWTWCLQLAAKLDLEAKGYDGAKWLKEDFGNAVQYQIWNLNVIKKYEHSLTESVSDTYDKLLDYISTTDEIPEGPTYILPDGKFVNVISDNRSIHANLFGDFIFDNDLKYYCDYYMKVIEHDYNWLRVNDGRSEDEDRCYISLNDSKLSNAQYDSLLRWLDYVSKHQAYVQVFINNDKNSYIKYDLHEYIPDDIIKRIKRYYSSGELYEKLDDHDYAESMQEALSANVINQVEDVFGSTFDPVTGPSYIMPSGKFLTIPTPKQMGAGALFSYKCHSLIYAWLVTKKLVKGTIWEINEMHDLEDVGCIRVNLGPIPDEDALLNYLQLSKKKPNSDQQDAILRWLDFAQKQNIDKVEIQTGPWGSVKSYSFDEYISDDILKKIISYYSYGKLTEQVLNEVYPKKGESKEDFISRFMSVTKDEYPNQKQRLAIAYSYWDRRNKKKESLQESDEKTLMLSDEVSKYYLDKYYPNYHKEIVSIEDVLRDTDNLHNDSMKTRRTEVWGDDPELYRYDMTKGNIGSRLEPIRLAKINNKFIVLDGNHRLRALSNSDYDNVEVLVRDK